MSMRKSIFKSFIFLLLTSGSISAFAQADRIRQALNDGNAKRAMNLAEEAEADPEFKKDPEIYFLKAEANYELMKDMYYLKKNPDALKTGIRAIEKGKSKNGEKILAGYDELVDKYVDLNDTVAFNEYRTNRYAKAAGIYQTSYELNGNRKSYFWMGKCLIGAEDTAAGEQIYNSIINFCNEQKVMGRKSDKLYEEAYIYFADKYWAKQNYDSANVYLIWARKNYGGNVKLDYYQKQIAKQRIAEIPPSSLMMEIIQDALSYFPKDTFFIEKENALYLYLMRNDLGNKDTIALDTMLDEFIADKIYRNESKDVKFYTQYDQFVESKAENVIWKLVAYYSKYEHPDIMNYLCHKYIKQTAASTKKEDMKKRYQVIVDYAARSKSLEMANQILTLAMKLYGNKDPELLSIQNSLISQNLKKELSLPDLQALYRMMKRANPDLSKPSEDFAKVSQYYVDQLIRDHQYILAKEIIKEHAKAEKDNKIWPEKLRVLAKEDFVHSYYETRIKEEEVAGMKVPGFQWNGDIYNCNEGEIDQKTQQKVEDRINYFRRQAGLPLIYLDPELNQWCQKAALMMEVNRALSHEPKGNWSCFSDEGAEACKYSLLIKDANTTMAVTSFFADNSNPTVGNRRWLLYPNGLALGHGSTENYCAIWALDDSGVVDTNKYKNDFVAWPPEGLLPKMMVFRQWSFSINQDIKGAKVTLTENGKEIPISLNPVIEGYGLPTLVWTPQLDLSTFPSDKDREITVTVLLKNGRKYTYIVRIMNFDAVGY
ncbi:MAG: hypothetical protein GC181_01900 [Bacteroidetes bacterium]|nr:hypothetical protein [Bacteroidota bacterium]